MEEWKLPKHFLVGGIPDLPDYKPPLLLYAIGVTYVQFLEYAWRKQLTLPDDSDPLHLADMAVFGAMYHLRTVCGGTPIVCKHPGQGDFQYVLSLYTNHSNLFCGGTMSEDKVKAVFETIKEELQITENPKWYFADEATSMVSVLSTSCSCSHY